MVITQREYKTLTEQVDKLRRFKTFVHDRLTAAGVPTHPDGPHSAEGCRIGDRLDLVLSGEGIGGEYVTDGTRLVAAERRQQLKDGRTLAGDEAHVNGELLACADLVISGVMADRGLTSSLVAPGWPRERAAHVAAKYKGDYIKRLSIAGALVAAEIDRLMREGRVPRPPAEELAGLLQLVGMAESYMPVRFELHRDLEGNITILGFTRTDGVQVYSFKYADRYPVPAAERMLRDLIATSRGYPADNGAAVK